MKLQAIFVPPNMIKLICNYYKLFLKKRYLMSSELIRKIWGYNQNGWGFYQLSAGGQVDALVLNNCFSPWQYQLDCEKKVVIVSIRRK